MLLFCALFFTAMVPVAAADEKPAAEDDDKAIMRQQMDGASYPPYRFDFFENKDIVKGGNPNAGFNQTEYYICSERIDLKKGQSLFTCKGVEFRAVYADTFKSAFNWRSEQTMSKDVAGVYIIFKRTDGKALTVDYLSEYGIAYTDFPFSTNQDTTARFSLNRTGVDQTDMFWCWWFYPQAVSFSGVRNCLYWGFTTSTGDAGIACKDLDTGVVTKNVLKTFHVDVHDSTCVYVREDGTVICAFPGGHNEDKQMHIRVSRQRESIDEFLPDQPLNCGGWVSYCQIVQSGGKYVMAYRLDANRWAFRLSDDCISWGEERLFVDTRLQYYCLFRPTTTDGIIRVVMYPNPSASQHDIRMGFYDVVNDRILNADCRTVLGSSDIPYTDFTVLIPQDPAYSTQRLMDCAITSPSRTMILYAPSKDSKSIYRLYDEGKIVDICESRYPLWVPKYQLGLAWIGTDKIVAARGDVNKDIIELYDYKDEQVILAKVVFGENRGDPVIRNAWPIVDVNNQYFLWGRGYFNHKQYKDFCMDVIIKSCSNRK